MKFAIFCTAGARRVGCFSLALSLALSASLIGAFWELISSAGLITFAS